MNELWSKIIKEFNREKLEHVLVGGAALVIYGLPRSTLDLDFYIPAKKEALKKLFKIADKLGLKTTQKSILKIDSPELFSNQWVCFKFQGDDVLDVFLAGKKEFNKVIKYSQKKRNKDLTIIVASLEDIAKMKTKTARAIDLADVKLIEQVKKLKKK